MNERIRELALQAEETYTYKDFSPNGGEETKQSKTVNLEKFAELIVRECIRIPYAMWDRAELNADVAVKIEHRIRDHFGMEQ